MNVSRAADESDSEPDFDPLNPDTRDDEGWEDVEAEEEESFTFKSLFDDTTFISLRSLFEYDKNQHNFDLVTLKAKLKLDFIGTIKLVNFVRAEVKEGNLKPDLSNSKFSDDKYLQPVLKDDPVLFSLGDLEDDAEDRDKIVADTGDDSPDAISRIRQLENDLQQARDMITELRLITKRNFDDSNTEGLLTTSEANRKERTVRENDQSYFKSYAYNDIHEVMLKDTVRTDAYRDFIYDNKELFVGKTVLDVGCGTGILSMMCARAGAKQVFAVDNSEIINRARANVFENSLQDVVTCLHGKIEEISLPVNEVDIIVSEWMGYALLYESMLDSVISARDRYLAPEGLMVPSHTTLFIAPVAIPDVVTDRIGFWADVYGFRMPAMLEGIFDEILLRNLVDDDIVGTPSEFLQLSLHDTKVSDTVFGKRMFQSDIIKNAHPLDGFAIWFDVFFAKSRQAQVPSNMAARDWNDGVAFTTGPGKKTTHWQQVVLLADNQKQDSITRYAIGDHIKGEVSYDRREENDRQLDISVKWQDKSGTSCSQRWELV